MGSTTFILRRFQHPFVPLLGGLLTFHVASPFLGRSPLVSVILTTVLLLTCVPAFQPTRRVRFAAIAGLTLVVLVRAASVGSDREASPIALAGLLVTAAYVAFVAGNVLAAVVRPSRVTANTIVGAICVYLLLVHVFGLAYLALESYSPGSIVGAGMPRATAGGDHDLTLHPFLYFSVITMTTLGYGDMMPASPAARSLVMLEALSGQFFLAVFVARFVGALGAPRSRSGCATEGGHEEGA